jgi:glycosyltransferase involved in cell wall biosynthesis
MGASLREKTPPRQRVRRATAQLDIALIVTTFERPRHLERCLESIAMQQGVAGRFEVVVADDGSTDETPQLAEDFARRAEFPVSFATRPHEGFQAGRCRNQGVAASTAPYLQFVDGDCILPPDCVQKQLARRRSNTCWTGFVYCLDRETTESITLETVRGGDYQRLPPLSQNWDLWVRHAKSLYYRFVRHPNKPRLLGGNAAIWREDYEAINGYDERFIGWGCEDDDVGCRLRRHGVTIRSCLHFTRSYHLWHPPVARFDDGWRTNPNVAYLERKGQLTRCRAGLQHRGWRDLRVQAVGVPERHPLVDSLLRRLDPTDLADPEVELLALPGSGHFSGRAECNLLLALDDRPATRRAAKKAHVIVSDLELGPHTAATFELAELDRAIETLG